MLCVDSIEEVNRAVREEELSNSTKYITVKKDKLFGKKDIGKWMDNINRSKMKNTNIYLFISILFIEVFASI